MPTINPDLVPTIAPGNLFHQFTTNPNIAPRWLVATDPVVFSVLNRPTADLALRQLILAKTLDNVSLRLGHQSLFPFLIQPSIINGSLTANLPLSWIWDMQVSMPQKWSKLRLAKIKRVSGFNPNSSHTTFSGTLRLVFTAVQTSSTTEVALFEADYNIGSALVYQIVRVRKLISGEEPVVIAPSEIETVDGFLSFRTLDLTDLSVISFLDTVSPPVGIPTNLAGEYTTPTSYSISDTVSGSPNEFDTLAVSHGTGLVTLSGWNPIPAINSDVATWVSSFNYPFDVNANLGSVTVSGVVVPRGLFKEFNILAPAGDNPTNDVTGNYFPVYLSRVHRDNDASSQVTFYFSTYNIESPSIVPVEFGSLTLTSTMVPNQVVPISPAHHLFPSKDTDHTWSQEFGRGHAMLSDLWGTSIISGFFAAFAPIVSDPPEALFLPQTGRLSSYSVSRLSKYSPTSGQAAAMRGSRDGASAPGSSNRYVVEADQGLGDKVDFAVNTNLPLDRRENNDIDRFGYTGALAHKMVHLVINAAGTNHNYDNDVLPRLRILLGREPVFADQWWDGSRLKFFNGDVWVG